MLYDYYHLGDEGSFDFDIKKAKKVGADFRNDLCNGMVKYFPDHFEDESKFCKALFIKKYRAVCQTDSSMRLLPFRFIPSEH